MSPLTKTLKLLDVPENDIQLQAQACNLMFLVRIILFKSCINITNQAIVLLHSNVAKLFRMHSILSESSGERLEACELF